MKGILAALGLAALVAGCDKNETFTQAECTVKGTPVRIEYQRIVMDPDKVYFYFGNIGTIEAPATAKATFTCDDGRILQFEDSDVYWGAKKEGRQ